MPTVTVSELQQFQRCRLRWDITSHHRRALKRLGRPRVALHLGSLIHKGIEAQLLGHDFHEHLHDYAREERAALEAEYISVVGAGWSPQEVDAYFEIVDKAITIVENYFDKWGKKHPLGPRFTYLRRGIEVTFKVPIPGTDGFLGGTYDGMAVDSDGGIWIVDHKSYSQKPSQKEFDFNFQFMCYMWAAERLFGHGSVMGFIYDGISTKLPTKPKVLKNGSISRSKNINTTPYVYTQTVLDAGQDPADYEDMIEYFEEKNKGFKTDFHWREYVYVNRKALQRLEHHLQQLYREISNPDLAIYPNFRWEGCWDCSVKDLCHAIMSQEDYDHLLRKQFTVDRATYGTTKALNKLTPETVTSIDDLR